MTVAEVYEYVEAQVPLDVPIRGFIYTCQRVEQEIFDRGDWTNLWSQNSIDFLVSYSTGTADPTNGSATVDGTDTVWTDAMVGRTIRMDGSDEYIIEARASNTEITLDRKYTGVTGTDKNYTIYQPEYSIETDVDRIVGMWNVTQNVEIPPQTMAEGKNMTVAYPTHHAIRKYTQIGLDSDGAPLLRFTPPSMTAAHVEYWYYKKHTEIINVDSTVDVDTDLEILFKQGALAKTMQGLGLKEEAIDQRAEFLRMLNQKWEKDEVRGRTHIKVPRRDRGLYGNFYPFFDNNRGQLISYV